MGIKLRDNPSDLCQKIIGVSIQSRMDKIILKSHVCVNKTVPGGKKSADIFDIEGIAFETVLTEMAKINN